MGKRATIVSVAACLILAVACIIAGLVVLAVRADYDKHWHKRSAVYMTFVEPGRIAP